jgi:hypothetical protein
LSRGSFTMKSCPPPERVFAAAWPPAALTLRSARR